MVLKVENIESKTKYENYSYVYVYTVSPKKEATNFCGGCRALCDSRNIGKLTKDQFALAIYLIQQKLKGVDPPAKLPPEMIPPSIRRSSLVV